jgi:hypothetical protein
MRLSDNHGNEMRIVEIYPGQTYPLKDSDRKLNFQIGFKLDQVDVEGVLNHKSEWSKQYQIKAVTQNAPLNEVTYIYHGGSYSIMVRQESEIDQTFNINIKTPVMIYNCLPCTIHIQAPRAKDLSKES